LVEIDYSGAPSLKEISRACRIPLEIKNNQNLDKNGLLLPTICIPLLVKYNRK